MIYDSIPLISKCAPGGRYHELDGDLTWMVHCDPGDLEEMAGAAET